MAGNPFRMLQCKKLGNSKWLESWVFYLLETPNVNPISKEKGFFVLESSSFLMRKREATSSVEG